MQKRSPKYYRLVPYFEQLGIKYASFDEIHKETRIIKNEIYRFFEVWLDRERQKRKDCKWFRGLEKPQQLSSNEDDYATITNFNERYKYENLSKEEKEIYNK